MALFNFAHNLYCSDCIRSFPEYSTWDRGFATVMRDAYAHGWVTCKKSRYDGGDGNEYAYCPSCASKHKENRFEYCV